MRIDPDAELVRYHRYLVVFVDDGATYQVDSAGELMKDLFPDYDEGDEARAREDRGRLAQHLARNFMLRFAYNRAAGHYSGPELEVYADNDPAAPSQSNEHTVVLDTSSAEKLLEGLTATGIVKWIDLDKVFSSNEPTAESVSSANEIVGSDSSGTADLNNVDPGVDAGGKGGEGDGSPEQLGDYDDVGPWSIRNLRGRARAGVEQVERWLENHPHLAEIRYELIYDGGNLRGFTRDWVELCELLMPGYLAADEEERARLRMRYSVDQQVALQAQVLASLSPEQRVGSSEEELRILRSSRAEPLQVEVWQAPAPLVLVNWHYQPYSDVPRPQSKPRDNSPEGANLWWIDVDSEEKLVRSLADIGVVGLGRFSIKRRQRRQGGKPAGAPG